MESQIFPSTQSPLDDTYLKQGHWVEHSSTISIEISATKPLTNLILRTNSENQFQLSHLILRTKYHAVNEKHFV
jgi:hypothetical protein